MTDFSPDAVTAALLEQLDRAEAQLVDAEKALLAVVVNYSAARGAIANVRAALAQPRKPIRKLALLGRFDMVQTSGRPPDREIERQYVGDDCPKCAADEPDGAA